MSLVPYATASIGLIIMGLYAAWTQRHFIKKIMAINIIGQGIFLLLVTLAKRSGADKLDPLPHAMVLTGIVVAVCATAFALYLARRIFDQSAEVHLPEDILDIEVNDEKH